MIVCTSFAQPQSKCLLLFLEKKVYNLEGLVGFDNTTRGSWISFWENLFPEISSFVGM
jgi:hypothetical protein